MIKRSKHDGLVDLVKNDLEKKGYEDVFTWTEYNNNGACREIDVYVEDGEYVLLFEVKCNGGYRNRKKAGEQLSRARDYYFYKDQRVFKFMVYIVAN